MNILGFNADRGGCGWYRIRQPLNAIKGKCDTRLIEGTESNEKVVELVEGAGVVVCRPLTNLEAMRLMKSEKKRIVLDFDDNYFELNPYSSLYKIWGQSEVQDSTGKWVWLNGVDGFDMFRNRRMLVDIEERISLADVITVTTPILQEELQKVHKDVRVLPNYFNPQLYPDVELKNKSKGSEFRIAWAGGNNHDMDLIEVLADIEKLVQEDKDVVFYVIGNDYRRLLKKHDRIRFVPWIEFQAHPFQLKSLDIDVAIIPLKDDRFNSFKSEVKFTEWSALGIPSIVKNVKPYSEVIETSTCIPFKTNSEMLSGIKALKDKNKANLIAKNAKSWAWSERNVDKFVNYIYDVYTL